MIKVRLLAAIFVLTLIASFGALGAGGVSAEPVLTVGILSPQGTTTVVGPDEATAGAVEAFTNVTDAGVVIENVDVAFDD